MTWNAWHVVAILAICLAAVLIAGKMGEQTKKDIGDDTKIIIGGIIGMTYMGRTGGRKSDHEETPPRRNTPPAYHP